MKKLLLLLLLSIPMLAQASPHENDFTWTASTTAGIQGYKVYRSVSGANTFTVIATLGTVTSYVDNTVVAGNKFDYKLTAFCPTAGCSATVAGESVFSNTVTLTTPPDVVPPNPASSLSGIAK